VFLRNNMMIVVKYIASGTYTGNDKIEVEAAVV